MSGDTSPQEETVAVASDSQTSEPSDASAEAAESSTPATPSEQEPVDSSTEASPPETESELDPQSVWGAEADKGEKLLVSSKSERRVAQRKGVRLNKLIMAQLQHGDESTGLYLHLVDISAGGVRVNGDVEFPVSESFHLKLQTESFGGEVCSEFPELEVEARVVWSKRLLGGMFVSGLQFLNMSDKAKACVAKILEICSPEGKRLRFRLNRVLGVGIGLEEQTRWLYPLALDLSVEGMRVRLDESLEIGATFPLQIFLEFDLPTVHMNAEVVWRDEVGTGRYQVGLRFHDLNEESAKAIQDYIDRCLAKEVQP